MALYKNLSSRYISLSTEPTGTDICYVYVLNNSQAFVSKYIFDICVIVSLLSFLISILLAIAKNYFNFLSDDISTNAALFLATTASLSAFSELFFFLWVRSTKNSFLSENDRNSLKNINLCKSESIKAYVAFMLGLWTPFINLASLSGGWNALFNDTMTASWTSKLFLMQIFFAGLFISAIIAKKISYLATK